MTTTSEPMPVLCEACAKLGTASTSCKPHAALLHRGSMPTQSDRTWDEVFRCAQCNTLWVRRVNKWGIKGAFRLATLNDTPTRHGTK